MVAIGEGTCYSNRFLVKICSSLTELTSDISVPAAINSDINT